MSASYVVVSPVKDEEQYVELTLRSMASQTLKPDLWVIVDDGSTDRTAEIVSRYASALPFLFLVKHPNAGVRRPGSGVIRAFDYGLGSLAGHRYDFVVKLDCDLSFEPSYFESLLERLQSDPQLGIASGTYAELNRLGEWSPVSMPAYHAFGACKVVRRNCFEGIGGFSAAAGWDTVDEIRAWSKGWCTRHFSDLMVKHHKREGSGVGQLRTNRMHGRIFYVTGGDPLFFLFKVFHRLTVAPVLFGAVALAYGYLAAMVSREPLLVTSSEARAYRRVLRRRLLGRAAWLPALDAAGPGRS